MARTFNCGLSSMKMGGGRSGCCPGYAPVTAGSSRETWKTLCMDCKVWGNPSQRACMESTSVTVKGPSRSWSSFFTGSVVWMFQALSHKGVPALNGVVPRRRFVRVDELPLRLTSIVSLGGVPVDVFAFTSDTTYTHRHDASNCLRTV